MGYSGERVFIAREEKIFNLAWRPKILAKVLDAVVFHEFFVAYCLHYVVFELRPLSFLVVDLAKLLIARKLLLSANHSVF